MPIGSLSQNSDRPFGKDTLLHIIELVISILSLTWHNYVFNTHTLIVTTQNISSNIVRGPILVLAKIFSMLRNS